MWRRATYYLCAFFEMLVNSANTRMRTTTQLSRFTVNQLEGLIRSRGAMALNNELRGASQLAALPKLTAGGRNGFVGVVLSEEIMSALLRNPSIAPGKADQEPAAGLFGGPSNLLELLARQIGPAGDDDSG